MRRAARVLIYILIFALLLSCAVADGFTQNSDQIEKATRSVLKLFVYESLDDDVGDYYATGSGFVAFNRSTLITNYHVIEDAKMVLALDDKDYAYAFGYVLCADKESDIAILEFNEPTDLTPLELYPDDQLKRGASIIAIGSPKETKNTVSRGIISNTYYSNGIPEIQIDAAISPGSSGGALFNDDGKVIGVTASGYKAVDDAGQSTGAQNINFAINIAVPQAMYNAWDGTRYSFGEQKTTAKMDFTDVYRHDSAAEDNKASGDSGNVSNLGTETWICPSCGKENADRFCQECGTEKHSWNCVCGRQNSGKFCGSCGKKAEELVGQFNQAMLSVSNHAFDEAIAILQDLGQFNSGSYSTAKGTHVAASDYLPAAYYEKGKYLAANHGDHSQILDCFTKAGEYEDAKKQIQTENDRYYGAFYTAGLEKVEAGEYSEAIDLLEKAKNYPGAKDSISQCYYALGKAAMQNGQSQEAIDYLTKSNGYKDSAELIVQIEEADKEKAYAAAMLLYNEGSYQEAKDEFLKLSGYLDADEYADKSAIGLIREEFIKQKKKGIYIGSFLQLQSELMKYLNYEEAKELKKEIAYSMGIVNRTNGKMVQAISNFEMADDYSDASNQLLEVAKQYLETLISEQNYDEASSLLHNKMIPRGYDQNVFIMQVGDDGDIPAFVLGAVKALNLGKNIPQNAKSYKEEYEQAVQKMEEYFSLTADGRISLDEYITIKDLIYVGCKDEMVKYLLEKLADLDYLKNLPEDHSEYKNNYLNAIKKSEKDYGLKVDGVVTREEYEVILNKPVRIDTPQIKAKINNDTVTLTWMKIPGAIEYKVYEYETGIKTRSITINVQGDYVLIGTTKECKWVL